MEEFIEELSRILKNWPSEAKWSMNQISMYTRIDSDQISTWVSQALGKHHDVDSTISYDEACLVLEKLENASNTGSRIGGFDSTASKEAGIAFAQLKSRLQKNFQEKDWRKAYKNLSYFLGTTGDKLNLEDRLEAYGECLRLGLKAEINIGEMGKWLHDCLDFTLEDGSEQSTFEALDLIDAYGEDFLNLQGHKIIEEALVKITPQADRHQLRSNLLEIKENLFK